MKQLLIAASLAATVGCASVPHGNTYSEYAEFAQSFDVNTIPNLGDRDVIALAITDINTLLTAYDNSVLVDRQSMDVHVARAANSLRAAQAVYLKYRVTLPSEQIARYDRISVMLSTLVVELETKPTTAEQAKQVAQIFKAIVDGLYN